MKNLKISTKLYLTLILYSTVFILVGLWWIRDLNQLNKEVDRLVTDHIEVMENLSELDDLISQKIIGTLEVLADTSHSNFDRVSLMKIAEYADDITTKWEKHLGSNAFGSSEAGLESRISNEIQGFISLVKALSNQPDSSARALIAEKLETSLRPSWARINPEIGKLVAEKVEAAKNEKDVLRSKFRNKLKIVILIVSLMLIGPGIMAIFMIIGIGKSIRQISTALHQMANGNLRIKFTSYGKDELGTLMKKLEETASQLQEVIATVRIAAINMTQASQELSAVSQDVAQGAAEQASTSEEIASSVEEMAGNIQQNSENAEITNEISGQSALRAQTVYEAAKSSLERIVEIAEKVSIIGDIAFQTNILSLNAAVEAARAGEHGRGFGVVASEVGKLADRSKAAANEINELSKKTVNVTEQSKQLLGQLIPDIQKTSELVQQISKGSQEQNLGAIQVNSAIQQLSMVTQQNAASSEEMATSAAEMSAQAKQLMQTMSFFSIEEEFEKGFQTPKPLPHPGSRQGSGHQRGVRINLEDYDDLDKDFVKF